MREAVQVEVEEYTDPDGNNPFREWYGTLNLVAADRVDDAIDKRKAGNTGNSKSVGGGVHELKTRDLRIYYGIDGGKLIILLGGGTKRHQQADINAAKDRWDDYKHRKENE